MNISCAPVTGRKRDLFGLIRGQNNPRRSSVEAEFPYVTLIEGDLTDPTSLVRAVDYLDRLRRTRMTPTYERPEMQPYFGLLPESISHEGYASHPVHSYWDDFFAVRALADAAEAARAVHGAFQLAKIGGGRVAAAGEVTHP